MKKIAILFFITFNFLFAYDLNNFEDRQMILQDVKTLILYEESIAKAYEEYILENYSIPSYQNITSLIGALTLKNTINTTISLDSSFTKVSYNLNNEIKADEGIKALYESDTFRKRTYYEKNSGKIYFLLEDEFAKHLYDLIKQNNGVILNCPTTEGNVTKQNCKLNKHIYIGVTNIKKYTVKNSQGNDEVIYEPDNYLITYHIDKFKTGPIVITTDSSKYSLNTFDFISKGALIYDTNGLKYVKTINGIEVLK